MTRVTGNSTASPREGQEHLELRGAAGNTGHTHSTGGFFGSGFGFVLLLLPSMLSLLSKFHCAVRFLFWCNR